MITKRIAILNKTTLDCLKENDERKIIKRFTNVAIDILNADFGFVWLKKRNSKNFELAYASPTTPFTPISPRKTGITHRVLSNKTPLLINRISKSGSVRSDAKKYLEGLATIPITYKNHTYGNMYICYKNPHKFLKEEQALSGLIGNGAAQSITINRLHRNLQDIKQTLDSTPQPKVIFDPHSYKITYFNKSVMEQTLLSKARLLNGKITDLIHPSSHKIFQKRLKHILSEKIPSSVFEIALKGRNNKKLLMELLLQYVDGAGRAPHLLAIFQDLKERKKSEEQIKHAAFHDTLTGLPNRLLFTNRLNTLLQDSVQKNKRFALIFVDLDRFKLINDTVGHLTGDSVLQQVALRLKKSVKRTDIVSRFGGDEFVMLLGNLKNPLQADQVVRRIQKSFETPFALSPEQEIYVNFSLGISTFPKDGADGATLLKNADHALYLAKQHGGNSYQHYRDNMAISDPGHLAMEKDLRKAIAHKELLLHYQPIIELKTGRVTSAEALVRWQHPSLGLLLPSMFIPYAEESGLIVKLGEWVFAEACRQLKIWRRAGINTTMSINISARELLQKDMIRKMQRIVRKYKLSPKDIALEVTETFLVKNMETSTKMLKEVRALGFKTSLDGFGTGYASLNYLKQLPVDYIKIDHPLVVGSVTNTQDAGIVQAIIAVAHHLHIKVVAEGVENDSQLRFLRKQNCDMVQGHFYSASEPGEKVIKLLKKSYAKVSVR